MSEQTNMQRVVEEGVAIIGEEHRNALMNLYFRGEEACRNLDTDRIMKVRTQADVVVSGPYIKAEVSHFRFTRCQAQLRFKVTMRCDLSDSPNPNAPAYLDREFTLKKLPQK